MASKGAHEHITEHVLRELGFSATSIEIAQRGNVAVDTTPGNQGSSADVANLHAMRGFAGGRMQTELEARNAVSTLLDREANAIVQSIRGGDFEAALTRLGAALHTVQDREFHAFGEWRYDSIAGAIAANAPRCCSMAAEISWTGACRSVSNSSSPSGRRVGQERVRRPSEPGMDS